MWYHVRVRPARHCRGVRSHRRIISLQAAAAHQIYITTSLILAWNGRNSHSTGISQYHNHFIQNNKIPRSWPSLLPSPSLVFLHRNLAWLSCQLEFSKKRNEIKFTFYFDLIWFAPGRFVWSILNGRDRKIVCVGLQVSNPAASLLHQSFPPAPQLPSCLQLIRFVQ